MIDLTQLSADERAAVLAQAKEIEAAEKQKKQDDRETLKALSKEFVATEYPRLKDLSERIFQVKREVFDAVEKLIDLKEQVYGVKTHQKSHTFTDDDGVSITLGHRVVDRYDDSLAEGIAMVREFVKSLAKDEKTAVLVETVLDLLKMDKDGNLKPNRVLELNKICLRLNNPELLRDGIDIIQRAYKPQKTCQFIEASYLDDKGKKHALPFAISAIE